MGMAAHGLCIGGEVVKAVATDKAKEVVYSLQVIHHHSLILTLFAAPGAEGQATSSSQGLGGMDALEMIQKKWMSFGEALADQLVSPKSFWPPQVSCTS